VSTYKLTRKAASDLAEILMYTVDTWGEKQAEEYLTVLSDGFDLIALNPGLGRRCDVLAPRLLRLERGSHVIFYKPVRGLVLISRILHQRMLPSRPRFIDTPDG
jgi:toxin ParE1/3/4